MKNKLKIAVIFLSIAFIATYSYFWHERAAFIKSNIEKAIADTNTAYKAKTGFALFEYQEISMSGYPFHIQANFAQAKTHIEMIPPVSTAIPEPVKFTLDTVYDEPVSLSSNLLINDFILKISGEIHNHLAFNTMPATAITTRLDSPITCHLGVENAENNPWNATKTFDNVASFLLSFRQFDCNMGKSRNILADTKEVLTESEGLRVFLHHDPLENGIHAIDVKLDSKQNKSTPAYDRLLQSYFHAFHEATHSVTPEPVFNLAAYGASDVHIDTHFKGDMNAKSLLETKGIDFQLKAFDLKNDLYDTKNTALFLLAPVETGLKTGIDFTSKTEFSPAYTALLEKMVEEKIRLFATAGNAPAFNEVVTGGKTTLLAQAVTPHLSDWGSVQFELADKGTIAKDANGTILLNIANLPSDYYKLALASKLYDIKLEGKGNPLNTKALLSDITLDCKDCDALINHLMDYAIAVDTIISDARPTKNHYVNPQLRQALIGFLHAINEKEATDKKDISIHIASDGKTPVTISGKQMLEVMLLFSSGVAPYLSVK